MTTSTDSTSILSTLGILFGDFLRYGDLVPKTQELLRVCNANSSAQALGKLLEKATVDNQIPQLLILLSEHCTKMADSEWYGFGKRETEMLNRIKNVTNVDKRRAVVAEYNSKFTPAKKRAIAIAKGRDVNEGDRLITEILAVFATEQVVTTTKGD